MTATESPYLWFASILRGDAPDDIDYRDDMSVEKIWQSGLENGVLALAYYTLKTSDSSLALPEALEKKLHQHSLNSAAAEMKEAHELRKVFSAFTDNNLDFLLMKGTPLSYSLYPYPYLRTRCDTDLLFQNSSDAEMAWGILKELGYQRPNAVSGQYVSHEFTCFRHDKSGTSYTLDLHWKLSNAHLFAGAFDYADLAESATLITKLYEGAWALSNLHALLLACMHRVAHMTSGEENRLIWLYDIHLLAEQLSDEEWLSFTNLAQSRELSGICLDGLKTTRSYLATRLPDEVMVALQKSAAGEKAGIGMGQSRVAMELSNLRAIPNMKGRLGLIKERLFPDTHYMLTKYQTSHRILLPYLYLRRIIEGMAKTLR